MHQGMGVRVDRIIAITRSTQLLPAARLTVAVRHRAIPATVIPSRFVLKIPLRANGWLRQCGAVRRWDPEPYDSEDSFFGSALVSPFPPMVMSQALCRAPEVQGSF